MGKRSKKRGSLFVAYIVIRKRLLCVHFSNYSVPLKWPFAYRDYTNNIRYNEGKLTFIIVVLYVRLCTKHYQYWIWVLLFCHKPVTFLLLVLSFLLRQTLRQIILAQVNLSTRLAKRKWQQVWRFKGYNYASDLNAKMYSYFPLSFSTS